MSYYFQQPLLTIIQTNSYYQYKNVQTNQIYVEEENSQQHPVFLLWGFTVSEERTALLLLDFSIAFPIFIPGG